MICITTNFVFMFVIPPEGSIKNRLFGSLKTQTCVSWTYQGLIYTRLFKSATNDKLLIH